MEYFQFCLEIVNREVKSYNVPFEASGLKKFTIDSANEADYNLIKKRCHFLFRCGAINLYFTKICFKTLLLDNQIIKNLLSKWKKCTDLTFCSISTGPALDYIAFLHSFQESGIIPPLFKNIKIVTKHGAWKNTANIMHEVISEGCFKSLPTVAAGNIKVLVGDPFKNFTQDIKSSIGNSDVIMMINRLNLKAGYNQKKISKYIKAFLDALKPGAVLFCIDTKRSIQEITRLLDLFSGTFLLKSTPMKTTINSDFPDVIKKHIGCLPIQSAEGSFFVWQKSFEPIQCLTSTVNDSNMEFSTNLKSNFAGQSAVASSFNLCDDYQLENGAKNRLEYSNFHLSSTSSQNACIQTESDEILLETDAKKIIELVHRIDNLTVELTEMLENHTDCNSLKNSQGNCKCLDPNDDLIHNQCSSMISCSRFSSNVQNCKACSCDQHHALSNCCISANHAKINAPCCNFHNSNFINPLANNSSIISSENNLLSSARLVIPLANLSATAISQIVSLISQSEQK